MPVFLKAGTWLKAKKELAGMLNLETLIRKIIGETPTITQENTDWNSVSGKSELLNKPDLSLKADLVSGKVPAGQLPSYVDDV